MINTLKYSEETKQRKSIVKKKRRIEQVKLLNERKVRGVKEKQFQLSEVNETEKVKI